MRVVGAARDQERGDLRRQVALDDGADFGLQVAVQVGHHDRHAVYDGELPAARADQEAAARLEGAQVDALGGRRPAAGADEDELHAVTIADLGGTIWAPAREPLAVRAGPPPGAHFCATALIVARLGPSMMIS